MAINVKYSADPGLIAAMAGQTGAAQYAKAAGQQKLAKLQVVMDQANRQRQMTMQGVGQAAEQALGKGRLDLQGRELDLRRQAQRDDANLGQQKIGLAARGQDIDAQGQRDRIAAQRENNYLDAYGQRQGQMADLYKAGMSQQGAYAREWLQGQAGMAREVEQQAGLMARQQQQEQARQDLFELQFTRKQQAQLAKNAEALAYIDSDKSLTEDQRQQMRWEVQQHSAGIKPQMIPKPKAPSIDETIQQRIRTQPDGSTVIMQPDGKIEWRPAPKQPGAGPGGPGGLGNAGGAPPASARDISRLWSEEAKKLDANGNPLPDDEIERRVLARIEAQTRLAWNQRRPGEEQLPMPREEGRPAPEAGAGPGLQARPEPEEGRARGQLQPAYQAPPGFDEGFGAKLYGRWDSLAPEQQLEIRQGIAQRAQPLLQDLQQTAERLGDNPDQQDAISAIAGVIGQNPWLEQLPSDEWQRLKQAMATAGAVLPARVRQQFLQAMRARQGQ